MPKKPAYTTPFGRLLIAHGWSSYQIQRETGLDRGSVSRYARTGAAPPSARDVLDGWLRRQGVSAAEIAALWRREDDEPPPSPPPPREPVFGRRYQPRDWRTTPDHQPFAAAADAAAARLAAGGRA